MLNTKSGPMVGQNNANHCIKMDGKNAVVFLKFHYYIENNLVNASELPIFLPPIMHKRCASNIKREC